MLLESVRLLEWFGAPGVFDPLVALLRAARPGLCKIAGLKDGIFFICLPGLLPRVPSIILVETELFSSRIIFVAGDLRRWLSSVCTKLLFN